MNYKNRKHNSRNILLFILLIIVCFKVYDIKPESEFSVETLSTGNEKKYVYPLGNIVGIKADTDGVLVVGYDDDSVEYVGGMRIGDNITKINDKIIGKVEDINDILSQTNENTVKITFERDGEEKTENIRIKEIDGEKKLGLWVRNKISGMGTLTYYDPTTGLFAGIGHPITDVDTNKLLKIKQGYIYQPNSIDIIKGNDGKVGYIEGEFNTNNVIGEFSNNTDFGITGNLIYENEIDSMLIEVGSREDVNLGTAHILFEDKNRNITSYEVEIKDIIEDKDSTKNIEIEVTDERLLQYTNGIVQGMSGAPIIQNNKIVGAITHVFNNDWQKGYGIFIDEMIELDKAY